MTLQAAADSVRVVDQQQTMFFSLYSVCVIFAWIFVSYSSFPISPTEGL